MEEEWKLVKYNFGLWTKEPGTYLIPALEAYLIVLVLSLPLTIVMMTVMILSFFGLPVLFFDSLLDGSAGMTMIGLLIWLLLLFMIVLLIMVVAMVINIITLTIQYGGLARVMLDIRDGKDVRFFDVLKAGLKGFKKNVRISALVVLIMICLSFIPFLNYAIMFLVPLFILPYIVSAVEGCSATQSIGRAWNAVARDLGAYLSVCLFYFLGALIVSFVFPLAILYGIVAIPMCMMTFITIYTRRMFVARTG